MFNRTKLKSSKKLNGETPSWFRQWHDSEFMGIQLKVSGLLWLTAILIASALACFGVMVADHLRVP